MGEEWVRVSGQWEGLEPLGSTTRRSCRPRYRCRSCTCAPPASTSCTWLGLRLGLGFRVQLHATPPACNLAQGSGLRRSSVWGAWAVWGVLDRVDRLTDRPTDRT